MGLIRKAIFLGTAATGTPLVRWNSSAEAAAKEQRRLMQEQSDILSGLADQTASGFSHDEFDEDDYDEPTPTTVKSVAEPSLTDRLTEIKGLLDRGVISVEEHAAMRKRVLGL